MNTSDVLTVLVPIHQDVDLSTDEVQADVHTRAQEAAQLAFDARGITTTPHLRIKWIKDGADSHVAINGTEYPDHVFACFEASV